MKAERFSQLLQWLPLVVTLVVIGRWFPPEDVFRPGQGSMLRQPLLRLLAVVLAVAWTCVDFYRAAALLVFVLLAAGGLLVVLAPPLAVLVGCLGCGVALAVSLWRQRNVGYVLDVGLLLFPIVLLRSLGPGPLPPVVGTFLSIGGIVVALGGGWYVVRTGDRRVAGRVALFGGAIAGLGVMSPAGVATVAWCVLVLASGSANIEASAPWHACSTWVGWWMVVAALAAGRGWLEAMLCAAVACIVAVASIRQGQAGSAGVGVVLMGLLAPGMVQWIAKPVEVQIATGLLQRGSVEAHPWIGLIAMDGAHQRVMVLPVVVLAAVGLVQGAAVLLLRWQRRDSMVVSSEGVFERQTISERVWWLGHERTAEYTGR
ncbi:MAG: hypothetical protein NVS4B8_04470 [Herpetosiphon sp.]